MTDLTRAPNWPTLLAEYVEARRTTAFEYGVHDCCRFASGAVHAMTGEDPMASFTYQNKAQALRLIAEDGALEKLLRDTLGLPLESTAFALRGDVVLANLDNGPTVGIVLGALSAYAAETGLLLLPTRLARLAWGTG